MQKGLHSYHLVHFVNKLQEMVAGLLLSLGSLIKLSSTGFLALTRSAHLTARAAGLLWSHSEF